jgi:hypothetical protein
MKYILFIITTQILLSTAFAHAEGCLTEDCHVSPANIHLECHEVSAPTEAPPAPPTTAACPIHCAPGFHCQRVHQIVPEDAFFCARN